MDPHSIIDAQFNRAVEIVQNLPKTGPIQTGYEDKLDMYRCALRVCISSSAHASYSSLFKQGNPRPLHTYRAHSHALFYPRAQQPWETYRALARVCGSCYLGRNGLCSKHVWESYAKMI